MAGLRRLFSYYPLKYFTNVELMVEVPDTKEGRCNLALLRDGHRWGFLNYCLTNYDPDKLDRLRVDFRQLEQLWQDLSPGIEWKESIEEMLHFIMLHDWNLHDGAYSEISKRFVSKSLHTLYQAEEEEEGLNCVK
jgi:hypothetical protein